MRSDRATTAALRMPADLTPRDTGRTLAGLIDVLDRADEATAPGRPRPTLAATSRAAAHHRAAAGRSVPLRSVRPAPPARPALAPFGAAAEPAALVLSGPAASLGPLSTLLRRAALWGAGPQGAYLAWRSEPATAAAGGRAITHDGSPVARPRLRARLVRSVALWGAGPHGEHLAWSAGTSRPSAPVARTDVDRPVVLRELPSTPTITRVASSPATTLVAGPASSPAAPVAPPVRSGIRPPVRPVVRRLPAGSRDPMPPARTPPPTGWPVRPPRQFVRPTSSFPAAGSAGARSRGDPLDSPARGSPRPLPRPASHAPG